MREATLLNYRNPVPAFNSTYSTAVIVANHLQDATLWQRLRSGYRIPRYISAQVLPQTPVGEGMELLDVGGFGPGGYLNDELLNHHIALGYPDSPVLRVPVGYLAHYFLIGPLEGYREVARLAQALLAGVPGPAAGASGSDPEEAPIS